MTNQSDESAWDVYRASRVAEVLRIPAALIAALAVFAGSAFCEPQYVPVEVFRPPGLGLRAVPDPACFEFATYTFGPENLGIVAGVLLISVFSGLHRVDT